MSSTDTPSIVRCPVCSTKQPRQRADTIYFCEKCRGQFDDDPEEGGTHDSRNPAARLEREEREAERRRERRPHNQSAQALRATAVRRGAVRRV